MEIDTNIKLNSPVSILKGIGMFLVLLAAAKFAVKGLAYLAETAVPGKGGSAVSSIFA